VVSRGFISIVGGSFTGPSSRQMYAAAIQDGGTLATWQNGGTHFSVTETTIAEHNGFVYLVGGESASNVVTSNVWYAPIEASGFPGAFVATSPLNVARRMSTAVVVEVP
jgi:hypothetical protein